MFFEYQLRNFQTFELRLRYGVEVQQMNPDIVNPESVFTISIRKFFSTQFFVPYKLERQRRNRIASKSKGEIDAKEEFV